MYCPSCQSEMTGKNHGGISVDVCVGCEGVWFDRGEIEAYRAAMIEERDELPGQAVRFEPETGGNLLKCPRCLVDTLVPGGVQGLNISCCSGCKGFFVSRKDLVALCRRKQSSVVGDVVLGGSDIILHILSGVLDSF
ncbi:MAG: zf-TFIIB domain-containing protein [Thermodesulfobacteriota bacterium]